MSDVTVPDGADQAANEPTDMETFLGKKPVPRWWRWLKRIGLGTVLLLIAFGVFQCTQGDNGPKYITEEVARRSLDLTVTATGSLRPTNQVEVGSEISGRVDDIRVDVNDRVARGQILAVVNTEIIDDQIAQARANANAARAGVAQATAGRDVNKAQLARLREVYRLSDGKVPSQTELEQAKAAVARDEAAVAAARANVAAAAANLSSNATTRGRAVIRSPVAGVVLARKVEPGQTVAASFNTPTLFVIAEDLATMQLRIEVDEADVGQIEPGQSATFVVDAYPGRRFPASVERIDLASKNTASSTKDPSTGGATVVSYEARLTVDNPQGLLRPGMTATATVATQSTGRRLVVPNGALRFDPDAKEKDDVTVLNPSIGLDQRKQRATIGSGSRQRVHIIGKNGKPQAINVITGASDGRVTVVTSSRLKPGMKVITGVQAESQ